MLYAQLWQHVLAHCGHLQANNVKFLEVLCAVVLKAINTIVYCTFNEFYITGLKMTILG